MKLNDTEKAPILGGLRLLQATETPGGKFDGREVLDVAGIDDLRRRLNFQGPREKRELHICIGCTKTAIENELLCVACKEDVPF